MKRDIRFNRERMLIGAEYYAKHGITPQSAQIRVEVALSTGLSIYDFDIKKRVKAATEKVIRDNDLFISRAMGLALMVEKDDAKGAAPLLPYPMIQTTATPTGLQGFTNANALALYNGLLSIKTDQSVNLSGFPAINFLRIPEYQPATIVNAAGTALVSNEVLPSFSYEDLLYELPEIIGFAGNHTHEIKLEAPVIPTLTFPVASGYTPKVVLLFEGWLFQGGANEKYKTTPQDSFKNPWSDFI